MTNPSQRDDRMEDSLASQLLAQADAYQATLRTYGLINEEQSGRMAQALEGARRQKLGERPESLLSIMLLGASGAGKSELLNALAGERIARSHHARPTTTRPTVYAHADIPMDRLYEFGSTLGHLAEDPASVVRHRRDELRHKILIDAPDIDSFRSGHRQQVLELLPAVDVLLYVVTGWTYRDDIGWRTVLEGRGHRAVAFVMNKWDQQGRPPCRPGEVDVDADFLRLLHTGGWQEPILFRTSAAYWSARRSRSQPETEGLNFLDGQPPEGDQFPQLEDWLGEGLSTSEVAQIQRRKRRGLWGELGATLAACRPKIGDTQKYQRELDNALFDARTRILDQLRPTIEEAARSASLQHRREDSPDTPGPYGQITRLGRSLTNGLSSARQSLNPLSGLGSITTKHSRSEGETQNPSGPIGEILERVLQAASWHGRQAGIPVQWLEEQWGGLPARAESEVADALRNGLREDGSGAPTWRRQAARYTAYALDTLLFLAVVATTWRLTLALIFDQGATPGYVLSFVALVGCVVLLGNTAMAFLIPDRRRTMIQALDRSVDHATLAILRQPALMARSYLDDLAQLEEEARRLEAGINAQISELQREITLAMEVPQARPDTTERLYASPSARA